jgi:hypothetical protein
LASDSQWRERAALLTAPLAQRLERYRDDLAAEEDCELFHRLVRDSHLDEEGSELELRLEKFPTLPGQGLDQDFVARVTALDEPGLVAPFFTRFGRHFVFVPRILPALLPDEAFPDEELQAKRGEHLRQEMHNDWRGDALRAELDRMRRDRVVRTAAGE